MRRLVCAFALVSVAAVSNAADLKLSYTKTAVGPLFSYTFTLGVDESVTSWSPGMGWAWLIFGDAPFPGPSPMADFTMTSSFPVGPWTSLTSSSGGHNGPTFNFVLDPWIPGSALDTLTWTGTSAWDAPDGELLFSTLIPSGGATNPNFKVATHEAVPEPATMAVLGMGALALLRRRKK